MDFFKKQPHNGEQKDYCGYFAICNFLGTELDFDSFKKKVYSFYKEEPYSLKDENEIKKVIENSGARIESIAINNYEFIAKEDKVEFESVIEQYDRFMAAGNRYDGHWLTYIRHNGEWWEYDSWTEKPIKIGNNEEVLKILIKDNTTSLWVKN